MKIKIIRKFHLLTIIKNIKKMEKQIVKNTLSSSYPNHEQSHSSTKLSMVASCSKYRCSMKTIKKLKMLRPITSLLRLVLATFLSACTLQNSKHTDN